MSSRSSRVEQLELRGTQDERIRNRLPSKSYLRRQDSNWRTIAPRIRIVKNALILGLAFLLAHGVAFAPLRTFAALAPKLQLLGPWTLALFYSCAALSAASGAARWLTGNLGLKGTIVVCLLNYLLIEIAVAYRKYWTLLPAAAFCGAAQAPLWFAASAYIINIAAQYGYFSYKTKECMVPRLMSSFNTMVSIGWLLGHLLSGAVYRTLEQSVGHKQASPWAAYASEFCGRRFCNGESASKLPSLDIFATPSFNFSVSDIPRFLKLNITSSTAGAQLPVYFATVGAVLIGLSFLVTLVSLGKLKIQFYSRGSVRRSGSHSHHTRDETKPQRNPRAMPASTILVVLPLICVRGAGQVFLTCDIMKGYVGCTTAKSTVGYVLFGAGCVAAFLHAFLSTVLRHISRVTVLSAAIAVKIGCFSILWMWKPVSDDQPILYVIAISWQMSDIIIYVLCQSMILRIGAQRWETPLLLFCAFTWAGQAIGYLTCPFGCIETKLYAFAFAYAVSLAVYSLLELRLDAVSTKQPPN